MPRGNNRVDTIEEKLKAKLAEKFGGDPQLGDSLVLIGVDSIGMAELTLELEADFGISVDEDVVDVETVSELAEYIRVRQK
ncbi:MAG: hypothetical protein Aurels2KO_37440 [Aureliella sp.]